MKKILFIGVFLLLASNIFAQEHINTLIPIDWKNRAVSVSYVQVGDSLYPAKADTNGNLIVLMGGGVLDTTNQANRVVLLNSPVFHYTEQLIIIEFTDLNIDSTQYVFNAQSYPKFSLTNLITGTGVTYKTFITGDSTASDTNPYDGKWIPSSLEILGNAAGLTDVNSFAGKSTEVPFYKAMVKVWTTTATNSFKSILIKSK